VQRPVPAPERPATVRAEARPVVPRPALRSPPATTARAAAPDREQQVVRITIGRVDVRAVQEPAQQAPRPRPAPPRMTLAEYLARGRPR
jgi:hypothetical protein